LALIFSIIVVIVTLPYTLFYYPPNFGIRRKDMVPVQLYLDNFQRLHPQLISAVSATYRSLQQSGSRIAAKPSNLQFWPSITETFIIQEWSCSATTALFANLESAGWSRQVLWAFLRDQVEREPGLVSETQKADFARVMENMCSHNLVEDIERSVRKLVGAARLQKSSEGLYNFSPSNFKE
jgi:hypothetical protein